MLWYTVMHLECIIIIGLSFDLEAQTRRVMILLHKLCTIKQLVAINNHTCMLSCFKRIKAAAP